MGVTNSSLITIGNYLIQRLKQHGVDHVFGVPGDYVLEFDKGEYVEVGEFLDA